MTGSKTPNTGPNITESIQRSLQNCSLSSRDHNGSGSGSGAGSGGGGGRHRSTISESGEDFIPQAHHDFPDSSSLELNSQIRLPYYWEQCLDLKSGEVYYINWRTGMKSRDDPRMRNPETNMNNIGHRVGFREETQQEQGPYEYCQRTYSDEDEDEDEEESSSSPSISSSTTTTTTSGSGPTPPASGDHQVENESSTSIGFNYIISGRGEEVLVVTGCKRCFMYFMVPKHLEQCPKCFAQLLHFDRSDDD